MAGGSAGPHAFVGFKDKSCFHTPAVLILRSGISVSGDCPLSGRSTFLLLVNTDKICSFNVSDFYLYVIHSFVCVLGCEQL